MIEEKTGVTNTVDVPLVVERDDGKWSIGFHDNAAGPFESRRFAESVAARCAPPKIPAKPLSSRWSARWR
jgi:hypothetical protein